MDIFIFFENNSIGGVQMNFTTKERYLLEDQKSHEKICVQKYASYASMASCPELKAVFQQNGQHEQQHYDTIDQLLKGQMPTVGQSSQQSGSQQQSGGQKQSGNQQQSGGQQSVQSGWQQQMQSAVQRSGSQSVQSGGQQSGGQQSSWSQSGVQQSGVQQSGVQQSGGQKTMGFNATDKDLCTDMLMSEKYVSSAYNTAIFEFRDPQVRNILNHIQKEEQQHGEAIFKYMESKGMYSVQ